MNKIKAAIIGLGVGEKHLLALKENPQVDVVSICDHNVEKLLEVSLRHPDVKAFKNPREVINDPSVNLVCIASNDNFHCEQILHCIQENKHIFVEKPLCLTLEEAIEIQKSLVQHSSIKLSSNLILRKSARFIDLKKRIQSGEFGDLYAIDADYQYGRIKKLTEGWRGSISNYSVFLGGGVHMVDLVRWLTEEKVKNVYATGNKIVTNNSKFDFDDYINATLSFENGLQARVSANFGCVHPHFHSVRVFGTSATFINEEGKARIYHSSSKCTQPELIDTQYPGCGKGDLLNTFAVDLLLERDSEISQSEVFETVSVCFAVEQSLQTNSPVDVDEIRTKLLL